MRKSETGPTCGPQAEECKTLTFPPIEACAVQCEPGGGRSLQKFHTVSSTTSIASQQRKLASDTWPLAVQVNTWGSICTFSHGFVVGLTFCPSVHCSLSLSLSPSLSLTAYCAKRNKCSVVCRSPACHLPRRTVGKANAPFTIRDPNCPRASQHYQHC